MSVQELPQDISSYWYDKTYDVTSGREVSPGQRFFRFIIQNANDYQHLANSHLVFTFRVKRDNVLHQTAWCGDVRQMIDRCSLHLDGNQVEYHNYVAQWAKIDPLYWGKDYLRENGSLMGVDLSDTHEDWQGFSDIDTIQPAFPLPEVVTPNGGANTEIASIANNKHTSLGRRLERSIALAANNQTYLYGKWITLRLPLRNLFKFYDYYNGIQSGVQADIRIWLYENNAMLMSGTQAPLLTEQDYIDFKSVYLDVARLTVPKPLSLSHRIEQIIPDQYEVYRNTIPQSTSAVNSIFILNSVDKITRVTFFFIQPNLDIGTRSLQDKNYLYRNHHITNFKCFINDRLVPKMDLNMPYYSTTTADAALPGGPQVPLAFETVYNDVTMMYDQYLKRVGQLLPNRKFASLMSSGNFQSSGVLDYETFRTKYPHYTMNVEQREYHDPMLNLTVNFTCGHQNAAGDPPSTPAMTMYTIVEKIQEVGINVKGTNASISTIG